MKIFLAISSHGFGHLSQVSPIINKLIDTVPDTQLFIQSLLDKEKIASRIDCEFHYIRCETDVGIIMDGALNVLADQTALAYEQFHQGWDGKLSQQMTILEQSNPDIVIADIPYLTLAAAQRLNIVNVAICSLNWADILQHYCGNRLPIKLIQHCYAQSDLFIKPEPSMPMSWLQNTNSVGILVRPGQNYKNDIKNQLGMHSAQRLVLVSLGGIDTNVSFQLWARDNNTHFIVQDNYSVDLPWVHSASKFGIRFSDIVQSVDAIITKPGYGIVVESVWGGTPVLYIERKDWPEESYLIKWLKKYVPAAEISREQFENGDFKEQLDFIFQQEGHFSRPEMGVNEAVSTILELMDRTK